MRSECRARRRRPSSAYTPTVVGAGDVPLGPTGARQHLVPPDACRRCRTPEAPRPPAHRDDPPVLNPGRHVAPRLPQLLLVAKKLPAPPKDLVPLDLEKPRIEVAVRPNRRRPRGDRVIPLPGARKLLPSQPLRHESSPSSKAVKIIALARECVSGRRDSTGRLRQDSRRTSF